MEILGQSAIEGLSTVYLARSRNGRYLEFVESLQPPFPIEEKWVLIISVLYGCPVRCMMCDAGSEYHAKVSKDEMFGQIDRLFDLKLSGNVSGIKKLKIQFARMGDPAFNIHVLDLLEEFHLRYDAPGFCPSISTIGPAGRQSFFERLAEIKKNLYRNGRMQFQFSVHTTDSEGRDRLIPARKMSFREMSDFGEMFCEPGDRKISLNFAASGEFEINPLIISDEFDPGKFIIKLTPLNPTYSSAENSLTSLFKSADDKTCRMLADKFRQLGFEVIVSIGEARENSVGTNCGQFVKTFLGKEYKLSGGYDLVNEDPRILLGS